MNEYEPFVRLILDNPADQTCRLVFADWLEEHNDLLHAGLWHRLYHKLMKLSKDDLSNLAMLISIKITECSGEDIPI